MADIISIQERLRRGTGAEEEVSRGFGSIYRIRIIGRDRRAVEIAARTLGRVFAGEGYYFRLDEEEERPEGVHALYLRIGREIITETGCDKPPGLLLVSDADCLDAQTLGACSRDTILLVHHNEQAHALKHCMGFPGTVLKLPVPALSLPEPWFLGASCAGGGARVLGQISWTALEQALREELVICDPTVVNRNLSRALEAYDRMAPWAGRVVLTDEELGAGENEPA